MSRISNSTLGKSNRPLQSSPETEGVGDEEFLPDHEPKEIDEIDTWPLGAYPQQYLSHRNHRPARYRPSTFNLVLATIHPADGANTQGSSLFDW